MTELRVPLVSDLPAISALCIRSKAHWGYDAAFMDACRAELTMTPAELAADAVVVAADGPAIAGVGQVGERDGRCVLERLFVDPAHMGEGLGRRLFDWARATAIRRGATALVVESDPFAAPFYRRLGCVDTGTVPSGSIPGRALPCLSLPLSSAEP